MAGFFAGTIISTVPSSGAPPRVTERTASVSWLRVVLPKRATIRTPWDAAARMAASGFNSDGVSLGEEIYSYGNSGLRFGISQLSPKYGTAVQTSGDGWTHTVYTATPGIPGDSGSAYLDGQGRALGVVSTVAIAPLAASNNVTDLSRAMAYMAAHEADLADVVLAEGTEPFAPLF